MSATDSGLSEMAEEVPQDNGAQAYDDFSDYDSAYSGDDVTDSWSITSSIYTHRFEHGRRYHSFRAGQYWGPNDEIQNEQLDIAHHMFLILLDEKLWLAPIETPKRILDIGTGTGIWAIDVADAHPAAEVRGIDLSPIQPQFVPPNLIFEIDDCSSPWTFPANHFDLIHIRALYGSISDWPELYREVYDHLMPGGWIDQIEMNIQFEADDGTCPPDHVMSQWSEIFIGAGEQTGKTFKIGKQAKGLLENAGFVNVVEQRFKVPVGTWAVDPKLKALGRWNFLHCYQGAEGWGLFILTKLLNWSYEAAMVFIASFKEGLKDKHTHAYFQVIAVYGQKPMSTKADPE